MRRSAKTRSSALRDAKQPAPDQRRYGWHMAARAWLAAWQKRLGGLLALINRLLRRGAFWVLLAASCLVLVPLGMIGFGVIDPKKSEDLYRLALMILGPIGLLLAVWRSKIAQRQAETAERGHQFDRFQRGAAMLGDKRRSVREAGISALKVLAEEDLPAYFDQVQGTLTAFIRERSAEQWEDFPTGHPASSPLPAKREDAQKWPDDFPPIAADVQTALSALSVLLQARSARAQHHAALMMIQPDLTAANLKDGRFNGFNLSGVDLSWANLSGAFLMEANLTGARLFESNLSGASLMGTNLSGASLMGTNLSDAKLMRANLSGASLMVANLSGASLDNANLSGAELIAANLSGAFLMGANLSDADLDDANLQNAEFYRSLRWDGSAPEAPIPPAEIARCYPATGLTREQLIKAKNVDPDFIAYLAFLEEEKGAKAGKDGEDEDGADEDGADEELGQ